MEINTYMQDAIEADIAEMELETENLKDPILPKKDITPLEEMSDADIIRACMSEDEAVATNYFELSEFEGESVEDRKNPEKYKVISERMIYNALVEIEPRNEIVSIRLKFKSAVDPELRLIWSLLKDFGKRSSLLNENQKQQMLSLSIMPNDYAGQVMVMAMNPILWTLEPETVGMPINNIIHMDFWANSIYIIDGDELGDENIADVRASVDRMVNAEYVTKEGEKVYE